MSVGKFHNYSRLIKRHKRSFQLAHKKAQFRDPDTSRYVDQGWDTPVDVEGSLWFITQKDFKRYPDFELILSDIKIITSTDLMNGYVPAIKDKLVHNGSDYYIKHIVNQEYYGNFYILLLTKVKFDV